MTKNNVVKKEGCGTVGEILISSVICGTKTFSHKSSLSLNKSVYRTTDISSLM